MEVKTYQRSVNTAISRRGLGDRRGKEARLSLPSKYQEWAERTAEDMITQISLADVRCDRRPRRSSAQTCAR